MPRSRDAARVGVGDERRGRSVEPLQGFFRENLDRELRELEAGSLLDFFVGEVGTRVYVQAVRDAHHFLPERLLDLPCRFYEPESGEGNVGQREVRPPGRLAASCSILAGVSASPRSLPLA